MRFGIGMLLRRDVVSPDEDWEMSMTLKTATTVRLKTSALSLMRVELVIVY